MGEEHSGSSGEPETVKSSLVERSTEVDQFYKRFPEADFGYWLAHPLWTISETLSLIRGREPVTPEVGSNFCTVIAAQLAADPLYSVLLQMLDRNRGPVPVVTYASVRCDDQEGIEWRQFLLHVRSWPYLKDRLCPVLLNRMNEESKGEAINIQRDRLVQELASECWSKNPDLTCKDVLGEVAADPRLIDLVRRTGCTVGESTLQRVISKRDPRPQQRKRGRPRKGS